MRCPLAFRKHLGLGLSRRLKGKGVPAHAAFSGRYWLMYQSGCHWAEHLMATTLTSDRLPSGLLPRMGHRDLAPKARLLEGVREDRQRVLLRRHPAAQAGRGLLGGHPEPVDEGSPDLQPVQGRCGGRRLTPLAGAFGLHPAQGNRTQSPRL
jgi:hypothetical protein